MSANATYAVEHYVEQMVTRAQADGITEMNIFGSTITTPPTPRAVTLEQAQDIVNRAWAVHGQGQVPRVRARASRGGSVVAHATRWEIALNDSYEGRNELTLMHELAHCLTPGDGHGRRWKETFLTLAREYISPEISWLLMIGFAEVPSR